MGNCPTVMLSQGIPKAKQRREQVEPEALLEAVLTQLENLSVGIRVRDAEALVSVDPICTTMKAIEGYVDFERRMPP